MLEMQNIVYHDAGKSSAHIVFLCSDNVRIDALVLTAVRARRAYYTLPPVSR